jgi:hypothetical protein
MVFAPGTTVITGGVMSCTVIDWLAVLLLPH